MVENGQQSASYTNLDNYKLILKFQYYLKLNLAKGNWLKKNNICESIHLWKENINIIPLHSIPLIRFKLSHKYELSLFNARLEFKILNKWSKKERFGTS